MKILVLASNYPHPGYRFSGIFNERSVHALSKLCDRVEVLAPRPYVPPLLSSLVPRWKSYATVPRYKNEDGIAVYRPPIPVVPGVAQAFWADQGAFLWCRQTVRKIHHCTRFDAIVSFDLMGAGGLAWRLGRDLQLPASGWATGGDVRVRASSSHGQSVTRALKNLDLVFYQSYELLEIAAELLGVSPEKLVGDRHMVLPRGIPEPPLLARGQTRDRTRARWGVKVDDIVVLYVGRISRPKGMLELLKAIELVASRDSRIKCVLIGSRRGLDDTALVTEKLNELEWLRDRVTIFPECNPGEVWENLCGADIFAFPSHHEGMPNSLLEAMAMGLPAIVFGIPALRALEAGTGALVSVSPLDCSGFAEAILRLAACPDKRMRLGEKGKTLVMDRFLTRKSMAEALRKLSLLTKERRSEVSKSSHSEDLVTR